MSEENKAIVRRIFEEIWNQDNLAEIDSLISASYVGHVPSETIDGQEGLRQFVTKYRTALPDLHFTIDDLIDEGDKVVTRWRSYGTHNGELEGIAPTGIRVQSSGISISHFGDGKVVEDWINWDALGLMQQLGVIPES